jgi:hypothetical protein
VPVRKLSTILWHERRLVALVERGLASRTALHVIELDRAVVVDGLAKTFALGDDVTLRDLADRLPDPWPEVFDNHHSALAAADRDALPRSLADFLR